MYCIYTMTIASMKMFLRNRQALFFSLFMPLMILFIFGSMDFGANGKISLGLVTHSPNLATTELLTKVRAFKTFNIHEGTLDAELAELRNGSRTLVLDVPDNLITFPPPTTAAAKTPELTVYSNEGRSQDAGTALSIVDQFADKATLFVNNIPPLFTIKKQSLSVHNFRYIEFLLPGVIAMAIMQMSVFSVAFVFAQYREKGILKRLMATPMRPYEFVTANIITRLCMSVAQAAIFIAIGVGYFHVPVNGSYALLALTIVLGSLGFLGLGFTISGIAKTVESVPVFANILVFPMLFLGSVFFPDSSMPSWMRPIANNLPLTFFSKSLRGIMTNGDSFGQLQHSLLGLTIWAVILVALATLTFKFQDREGS
jgi:ABC-2 type transport system permease protein